MLGAVKVKVAEKEGQAQSNLLEEWVTTNNACTDNDYSM